MLNQLLETKQATQRRTGGTLVSVVLHVLVIGAALQVTQHAVSALPKPEERRVQFQPVKPAPSPLEETRPRDVLAKAPAPFGHTALNVPVDVPVNIPSIDLTAQRTNAADFVPDGVPGGRPDGVVGAALTSPGDALADFEVDKAAAALPESARPAYPELLKASGVQGDALVQFVVDTLGRAELGSFRVLATSHSGFSEAVRLALPRMRFLPAESGGQKVRMIVQQRFAFTLDR
ncbi:MAG: TonB family protein [Gemmatimonadaceae bacterium]|nr:TonB family protein [Gemmatimonadaceae bacterium]